MPEPLPGPLPELVLGIDPGHGGPRNFGTTAGGVVEKDVNLWLAARLSTSLPHYVRPILLRNLDVAVSFNERGRRAAEAGCRWVLSIHVNANRNPDMCGAECYVLPNKLDAKLAARSILEAMPSQLRTVKVIEALDPDPESPGDWQEAPLRVLSPYSCPVVLAEVCYASNIGDRTLLQSAWGELAINAALLAGVARMLEIETSR